MLVSDLITYAMRKLRKLASDESPTAGELSDGLIALNLMLEDWSIEALSVFRRTRAQCALTAGKGEYTIGPSADWVADVVTAAAIPRPSVIESAGCILDPSSSSAIESPIEILLSGDDYAQLHDKSLQSTYPRKLWYNPTFPKGTVHLWPVPSSATPRIALYFWTPITQFTATSETVSVPPGYSTALIFNLALYLAPDFGVTIPPELYDQAQKSLARIKKINTRLNIGRLVSDYPLGDSHSSFDIVSGDWRS